MIRSSASGGLLVRLIGRCLGFGRGLRLLLDLGRQHRLDPREDGARFGMSREEQGGLFDEQSLLDRGIVGCGRRRGPRLHLELFLDERVEFGPTIGTQRGTGGGHDGLLSRSSASNVVVPAW